MPIKNRITHPDEEWIMNEQCFAFRDKGQGPVCSCLMEKTCPGSTCPFYKTSQTQEKDIQIAYERLRGLPPKQQYRISEQYYHGEMPWNQDA